MVHQARDNKIKLRQFLKRKTEKLNEMHSEIPEETWKFGPDVVQLPEHDFPERNLQVIVELPGVKAADAFNYQLLSPVRYCNVIRSRQH